MKKTISLLLAVIVLFSLSAYADVPAAAPDTIEIQFKVGDSVLKINGQNVEVETPFVEDGVTLVPLRVITEAFGAEVLWDDATQKITLTYEGTVIILQIGSKTATVYGKEQTLLLAPRIVNDKTMVPLRFITETFGAQVSYDDKTEAISVIKQKAPSPAPIPTLSPAPTPTPENTAPVTISKADDEGYKTYTNKPLGLSFRFPKDYTLMPNENNINEVVLERKEKIGTRGIIYFSVFRADEATTVADAANRDRVFLINFETDVLNIRGNLAYYDKQNVFSCSSLQSNTDLSGLDTRFFTYNMKENITVKSMYAVEGNYIYNLRFYDNNIDWKASGTQNINLLKDISIRGIADQQGDIISEWPEEDPHTDRKPTYYSSDYSLTLPASWEKRSSWSDFFGNYGAIFSDSKYCDTLRNGFVQYIDQSKKKHEPTWKDTKQNVTFTHKSGIAFNVTQLTVQIPEMIIMQSYTHELMNLFLNIVPEDLCVSSIATGNYKAALWGRYFQLNPPSNPPQATFYKTNYFDYTYVKNDHTYHNSLYMINKKLPNQLNNQLITVYMISVSIPEEAYTPASHAIISNILKSINIQSD